MSIRTNLRWPCVVLALPALLGCADAARELAPVVGRVTYEGKPLANADVVFAPENGDRVASGRTDQEGHYRLGTLVAGDGAIVGSHRVTISARGPDKPGPPGFVGSGLPGGDKVPGEPLIPEKYFSPETSGISRDVQLGNNEFDFDL
jgi:hypothetical protein